ncbi:MAG: S9 family peptidase [Bacteroidales bacterium]|nr:S9 family peptidase [Bacteroidales bacterium]
MNRILLLFTLLIFFSTAIFAQPSKKTINHTVFPNWKSIESWKITDDGKWLVYEANPAKGDGALYILNTESGEVDTIPRGVRPQIAPNGLFVAFMIEPQYDTLRAMKLRKVKKEKLPTDSLGVFLLNSDSLIKIPKVKSFQMPDTLRSYLIYVSSEKSMDKATPMKNGWWIFQKKHEKTTLLEETKYKGDDLVWYDPIIGKKQIYKTIEDFKMSRFGDKIALIRNEDAVKKPVCDIRLLDADSLKIKTVFADTGVINRFSFDYHANQWAFLFSADTVKKNKIFDLKYGNISLDDSTLLIADTSSNYKMAGMCPTVNGSLAFSKDGLKLFFYISEKPRQESKDTLLEDEKYQLDLWSHFDEYLQPQQLLRARWQPKETYQCFFHVERKEIIQLENELLKKPSIPNYGNANRALLSVDKPYRKMQTWDGYYADYHVMNLFDGSEEIVLQKFQGNVSLSPEAKYVLYYSSEKRSWFVYDIEARRHTNLTKDIPIAFYDEDNDMPMLPSSYGLAGWYKNDKYVVVYDQFDLWKLDPTGGEEPVNLTHNLGRETKTRFRVMSFDKNSRFLNDNTARALYAFDKVTKDAGIYHYDFESEALPQKLIMSNHSYRGFSKAKSADVYFFMRGNFQEYYNLYMADSKFRKISLMTDVNPQQKEYNWGTVELTKWTAYDGTELEGLIYKPEDFDSTKQYPMIVYFYETYSDNLNLHYIPKPSHSTINFTEYVSNGYIVFVPDIRYKVGYPAQSAYNAIVSGTEFMKKFSWINPQKIGIQGQSWGGYQVAMLVTMTNIYACAEAGAPVANMTSAYGGMRWGSGVNRAFQYEKTQSRIGATLWDSLDLYIENSPLFFVDKVQTPLLIMHNDKDGAVPYYQGIEFFNALRRLDKTAWLLVYNNDDHNLMKWPNRMDLNIRMRQFFDHYLKDEPMPQWMKNGIPAREKGKTTGYSVE